tara:strand:+ start:233 stop:643 length:411 start_codon:yes stop_codon:yes gene_type:complete
MGLVRGMSTLNTRKRKVKLTKAKLASYHEQWLAHNRWAKSKHLHDLRYNTVEEYIDYCLGKTKITREFKPYIPEPTPYRNTPHYPSMEISGGGCGTKKESPKYTGTLVKGIATMHKSNAVPVINQKEATEISRMAK